MQEEARLKREERSREAELRQREREKVRAEKAEQLRQERELREAARAERAEQLKEERKKAAKIRAEERERAEKVRAEEREKRDKVRAEQTEQRRRELEEARAAVQSRAGVVLSGTSKVLAVGAKIGGLFAKIGGDLVWELGKGTINAAKQAKLPTSLPPSPTAAAYSAVDKLREFRAQERAAEAKRREARAEKLVADLQETAELEGLLSMESEDLEKLSREELRSGSRTIRAKAKSVEADMENMEREIVALEQEAAASQQEEEVEEVVLDVLRAAKEEVEEVEVELLVEAAESELPGDDGSWDRYYADLLRSAPDEEAPVDAASSSRGEAPAAGAAPPEVEAGAPESEEATDAGSYWDTYYLEMRRGNSPAPSISEDEAESPAVSEGVGSPREEENIEAAIAAAEGANEQLTEQIETVMHAMEDGVQSLAENADGGTERLHALDHVPAATAESLSDVTATAESLSDVLDDGLRALTENAAGAGSGAAGSVDQGGGVRRLGFESTSGGKGFGSGRSPKKRSKKKKKVPSNPRKAGEVKLSKGAQAGGATAAAASLSDVGGGADPAGARERDRLRVQAEYDRLKQRMEKMEAMLLEKEAQLKEKESQRTSR